MLSSNYLGTLDVNLGPTYGLGGTPEGNRLIVNAVGGRFEGPRLSASIVPNGGNWGRVRANGSMALDVRGLLETDDGALIYLRYEGRIVVPPELANAVFDPQEEDVVDPSRYYFRVTPYFETSSTTYDWLNNIVAVGIGTIGRDNTSYRFFEIV
jgi:hypothetical protein